MVDHAPVPRHERSWRHPSEVGQFRRAQSRRPAPPLHPFFVPLGGVLGFAVVFALVAIVVPPGTDRETTPDAKRTASAESTSSTGSTAPAADQPFLPGFLTSDGRRFVLALRDRVSGRTRFVTTGNVARAFIIDAFNDQAFTDRFGRHIVLTPSKRTDDITVFTTDSPLRTTVRLEWSAIRDPSPGTKVIVRGRTDVSAVVGIAITADTRRFVPLGGDFFAASVAESSPVEDADGHVLGLYTERDGAHGYIPRSVIEDLLSRP